MTYESPTITELGSVEAFTRGDLWQDGDDGVIFLAGIRGNTPPVNGTS